MKNITLTLSVENVYAIIQVLDELPTKTGAFPLVQELKKQTAEQTQESESIPKTEV